MQCSSQRLAVGLRPSVRGPPPPPHWPQTEASVRNPRRATTVVWGKRFTGATRWSLDYRQSYWWTDYFQHPGVNDVCGFLYDEFRATFRIPKPLFDDILRRMRDSGVSENDNPQGPCRPWSSQDGNNCQALVVWVLCDTGYHKWRQTIMIT
jgi:hypothetical protein